MIDKECIIDISEITELFYKRREIVHFARYCCETSLEQLEDQLGYDIQFLAWQEKVKLITEEQSIEFLDYTRENFYETIVFWNELHIKLDNEYNTLNYLFTSNKWKTLKRLLEGNE